MDRIIKKLKENRFLLVAVLVLALIGLIAVIFLILYIPVSLGFWTYQVDPLNLVATLLIGYFAYRISVKTGKQDLIALEEFRPILKIPINGFEPAKNKLIIQNTGQFEADRIIAYKVFYTPNENNLQYTKQDLLSSLSTDGFYEYRISRHEYVTLLIAYTNRSTTKVYLKALNFDTEIQKFIGVGEDFDDGQPSPISIKQYSEILKKFSIVTQIENQNFDPYYELDSYLQNHFAKSL